MIRAWVVAVALLSVPGTLIDRVVAVVDKDVITQSELLTEARVALAWREGEEAASAELGDPLLDALREYVINQTLVAAQARRLGTADVPAEQLEQRVWQFRQRFTSASVYQAFLRRFGITEAMVQDIFRRDLGNDRTLQQRVRSRLSLPGEESAESPQKRYERAVQQWLDELRQSVEVRLLGPEGELELQGRP